MSIWAQLSSVFGGGSTPGINPGAGGPPPVNLPPPVQTQAPAPQPALEPIQPVARGQAEAKGLLNLPPVEPSIEEETGGVDAEAVVDAAEDRAKADARKNPWHFAAETLAGMKTAPNYVRPGSVPGATVGDTSLLEYYNKGNFNNIGTNQHSLGLLNMPQTRYY